MAAHRRGAEVFLGKGSPKFANAEELVLLTPDEVAAIARVSRRAVYYWLTSKQLIGVKVGSGWRVNRKSLMEFIESGGASSVQ